MTRITVFLTLFFLFLCSPARASNEIGYVENFVGNADRYHVRRGTQVLPLKLCLPLLNGDHIEALDDTGRITLRLVGHPEPVVWSRGDKDTPITANEPKDNLLFAFLDWTMESLSPLDDEKRQRVLTTIRGDSGAIFDVPLLHVPQLIAAGKRSIFIGWLKPSEVVQISIVAKSGKRLVDNSKAAGGLWTSPVLDLKPGSYRMTVVAGNSTITGDIQVVNGTALPSFPEDLTRDDIPDTMRRTVQALWLSAQTGGQYQLEALQLIGNDKDVRTAQILQGALIGGTKFNLPK